MALKSWWPLSTTWNDTGCGHNWGRWTECNEQWYQKRLQQIQDGTAEPLPASKWRDRLKGMKDSRILKTNIRKFSQEFLDTHTNR
jgi:hypothetical protein